MNELKVEICIGSACFARGNARNVETLEKYVRTHHYEDRVDLEIKGRLCMGNCANGPNVMINDVLFNQVTPERMLELLQLYLENEGEHKQS
ncbi:MAG: NAD(P)H-dependent oxidoreductase subunit E [Thermoguttaceae bacterium]|nr:NAD(P)H-dependent oxidoreductase subunit E [Thermoguttaceae bacterium]